MPLVSVVVTATLEHLGVLPAGQTAGAEEADKCLRALVSMLGLWDIDPQSCIGLQELTYTPALGTKSFTIGPAGQVVATQPLRIEFSSFYRLNSVDTPLGVGSIDEYNSQAQKDDTGPPQFVALERSYDTATAYLYPAADGSSQLHLWVQRDVVSGFSALTLNTNMTLPAGMQNSLEWCLAEEVAPAFSVPDVTLQRIIRKAANARRAFKRGNTRIPEMRMPTGVAGGRGGFNIYEG